MKIRRISVYRIDLPLKEPYSLSGGRLVTERLDSTFVRIDPDCGLDGWGEGCHWVHACPPAHGQGVRNHEGFLASSGRPGTGVVPDEEHTGPPVAVYGEY